MDFVHAGIIAIKEQYCPSNVRQVNITQLWANLSVLIVLLAISAKEWPLAP